jgi:putative hydroxymethylpyrimidine transport system substrate-binding protein
MFDGVEVLFHNGMRGATTMLRVKKWSLLLLAPMLLWMAVACGGDEPTMVLPTDVPTEVPPTLEPTMVPPTKVQLALDWYPNANHAGLYVAFEEGYFEDENLEVEMYTPSDPSTVNQTVAAGSDDFGINYQPDVLIARSRGVPVVSVAGLVQHPLNSVQSLVSSNITRPSDLAGRKVGYPGIPTNEPLLDTMLRFDGVEEGLEAVELVNVGFNLAESLIDGRVDACIGCYFSHESILMENLGYPVNVMRLEKFGVPDYYELVLVTSEDMIEDNPDVVQRFVRAVTRGYTYAANDPDAAIEILLSTAGPDVDEDIERPGIKVIAPLWTEGAPVGWQTEEKWANFAQWLLDNNQVESPVDASAAFTNEFVEEASGR